MFLALFGIGGFLALDAAIAVLPDDIVTGTVVDMCFGDGSFPCGSSDGFGTTLPFAESDEGA